MLNAASLTAKTLKLGLLVVSKHNSNPPTDQGSLSQVPKKQISDAGFGLLPLQLLTGIYKVVLNSIDLTATKEM